MRRLFTRCSRQTEIAHRRANTTMLSSSLSPLMFRSYCTATPTPPPSTPQQQQQSQKEEDDSIMKDMRETIATEKVVLFMKGTPEAPICGFSKRVADIMDAIQVEYTSFNVLAHPTVRNGIKEISGWPTIPQLFVNGEFMGGCDIVMEMAKNGQLYEFLDRAEVKHKKVNFSD
eukprot:PhF_6_TR5939/c0_g1_i3/m.8592/K07390/grxD, GLRX5; monothiol glutaredoxin